jgi:hypothetical protein
MAERRETKNSNTRGIRKDNRLRKDISSAGKHAVCEQCGKIFEQVWKPNNGTYTQFKMCETCRMDNARGYANIEIPYEPHVNQWPLHNSKARFKLLCAGSRFGKDRCMVNEFVKKFTEMLSEERGPELIPAVHGWIIAPTFPLARQVWRELKRFFPHQWIVNIWESDKMIETINDGIIEVRSADDAETLVGVGLDIVLVTEAARIKNFEEVWANLESRLMSPGRGPNGSGGLGLINSTPRGRNFFYQMYKWGQKDDSDYDEQWESWQYSSWDNPYLGGKDKSFLYSVKKRYPERIYRQEIMAEFLAEGNSVFPYADDCAIFDGVPDSAPGEVYTIGWDPARSVDFSGVIVRNSIGQVILVMQWQGMNWTAQLDRIEYLSRLYNNAVVVLDRTGLGETLPEAAAQRGIAVDPVYFTNLDKEKMVNNLALLIEQKLISYPNYRPLVDELKDYEYNTTKTGKITYGASSSKKHDDLVTALMLGFKDFVAGEIQMPWMGLMTGIPIDEKLREKEAKKEERNLFIQQSTMAPKPEPITDLMLEICVRQGYVPRECQLPGELVWRLIQKEDPCAGCFMDRAVCGGRTCTKSDSRLIDKIMEEIAKETVKV